MENTARKEVSDTWSTLVPEEQWRVYGEVIELAVKRGLRFALGGAFALASYTSEFRNTKDIDLYILRDDKELFIDVLHEVGLSDYFDKLPYVRSWIYRGYKDDIIVDLIWAFANDLTDIDASWLNRGPGISIRGFELQVIPVEELVWAKLYVMNKNRCDWPDIFNLLYSSQDSFDWRHLLTRVDQDKPLLAGLLSVYQWLCPQAAAKIPPFVWDELKVRFSEGQNLQSIDARRISLLDTNPWFRPLTLQNEG